METSLVRKMEEHGYRGRLVPVRHLADLQEAIEGGHRQGLFDEALYRDYLAGFVFRRPESLPEARSLLIVAYPDAPIRFTFRWGGERRHWVTPPTYLHAQANDRQAEGILAKLLAADGHRVVPAVVPKKLLATCSGLARYGKNNITYVEGLGSFHRLAAFYSDLPGEPDEWREPGLLDRCERCRICEQRCPTGAIEPGRFRVRAERCITYWNEKPGSIPFPAWMEGSWHNALVGCLYCQRACPENQAVRDQYREGAEFTEEETGLLLEGVPPDRLPAELAGKLQRWDLLEMLDTLPRNLKPLLEAKAAEAG